MNFKLLQPFIEKQAKSANPKIKQAAESLLDQVISAQQAEEISQPTLHAQESSKPLSDRPKDEVDLKIDKWMPDVAQPEPSVSEFGKAAASYSSDISIDSLPKDTQQDIFKFVPSTDKSNKVVQYGMVVDELLPKADHHNLELADKTIKAEQSKIGKKAIADKFQSKIDNKYILLLNDKIVDGHHFLSLAKLLNISCSLKVLDLTPLRFQKKAATSLFHKLSYGVRNNSRKGAA